MDKTKALIVDILIMFLIFVLLYMCWGIAFGTFAVIEFMFAFYGFVHFGFVLYAWLVEPAKDYKQYTKERIENTRKIVADIFNKPKETTKKPEE